jgi:polysaccharide export outer membrane protein
MAIKVNEGILVQPKDMISIVVTSRNPELAAMFNLATVSYQAGSESSATGGYNRIMGYSVDSDGDINFPIVGKVKVAGMTRWEVAETIKNELVSRNLLKDPVVTVEFLNFKISVLGEVNNPGAYTIQGDRINLLEALSLAGDLTIYGKRDNVSVIREQNGKRYVYKVDLRDANLFKSDAYYLQQNDVIYVEPNKVRAGQSTINENSFRSVSFWASISATLLTIVNLIITISNNN